MAVAGCGQHTDVCTGAKHPFLAGFKVHNTDLGVFEAKPLQCVIKFDIDTEVIGVELELVTVSLATVLIHIEYKFGNIAFDVECPVPVTRRFGLEIDGHRVDVSCKGTPAPLMKRSMTKSSFASTSFSTSSP